jgi:hypothetical protein
MDRPEPDEAQAPLDGAGPVDAYHGEGQATAESDPAAPEADSTLVADGLHTEQVPPGMGPPPPSSEQSTPAGGIDLDALALPDDYEQEFAEDSETTVAVRKASGIGFFRAHPITRRAIQMLEIKKGEDRGHYLVGGHALELLRSLQRSKANNIKLFPARLTLCYSRDEGLFLWPLRLPQPGKANQEDEWAKTALRVCKLAETNWVELFCPQGASCYHWAVAAGLTGEPTWPKSSLNELASIAFEGKYLTDPDDPVIRRLRGME